VGSGQNGLKNAEKQDKKAEQWAKKAEKNIIAFYQNKIVPLCQLICGLEDNHIWSIIKLTQIIT